MSDHLKSPDLYGLSLVRNALRREEMRHVYDIASNQAAARLSDLGADAMPLIETVLRADAACYTTPDQLDRAFPGLLEVLVTYFDIARTHDWQRAEAFLSSITMPLQVHGLGAIWSIWIGRSSAGPIPDTLLTLIQNIAARDGTDAGEKAGALLNAYAKFGRFRRASNRTAPHSPGANAL